MRIETHKGHNIVCGHIFSIGELAVGQKWMSSEGNVVTISDIRGDLVYYVWGNDSHCKDSFSFQCRYCLILETY